MSDVTQIKFLVVDDFSTMRRIVRGLLKEMGCGNIDEAEDGVAALRMLKAIKEDDALKHLPVLMVTAEARKEDIVLAAQSGAAGYIVKPFTKATLEEKVLKIFQKMAAAA